MHKQRKTRNSFTTPHEQAGVQLSLGKLGSITFNGDLGTQIMSLQIAPPSLLFSQLYMLTMMTYGVECPFGQLDSAVPAVSPLNSLCTPSFLIGRVV